ncbi:protein neuralized-like isoform X2 [Liolophura sinensis]|uniref:protein neuralized-like isoform X2 n=1 Tax=Liolophura sinensis TaxID=3198878 RepID=UPI0031581CA8
MGNQSSSTAASRGHPGDLTSLRNDLTWPLQYHSTHSENIEIVSEKRVARRFESFCKGICFSSRPVAINEKVFVKFKETSTSWSGVLRFGFTSVDPATVRSSDLPRYACPDLTNKPGHWAKALSERYAVTGNLLVFSVSRSGEVSYSLNGEDKGFFFGGVNVNEPLWALFDVYGNTVAVELVNPETQPLNNLSSLMCPTPTQTCSLSPQLPVVGDLPSHLANALTITPPDYVSSGLTRYHLNINFSPMPLHRLCGKNVKLSPDRTIGIRSREDFCNGYVFTDRPLSCGEKIVLQILGLDDTFDGGLGFGFTSCDPDTIQQEALPDDSDLLLDRMEYWVVNKDVCRNAEVGDELGFTLTVEGEVKYSRNNHRVCTLMHVDRTLPLWAFFDIYGSIQKVKLLGVVPAVTHRTNQRAHSTSFLEGSITVALPPRQTPVPALQSGTMIHPAPLLRSTSVPTPPRHPPMEKSPSQGPSQIQEGMEERSPMADNADNECTVCYERAVNSVLYTCGHMCMCYECAILVQREKDALCPICRQKIKDVIKTYRT